MQPQVFSWLPKVTGALTGCVELQNTAFNLLFAGHDTSASVMVMLLRYLKLCPGVLQKLREEQRQVLLHAVIAMGWQACCEHLGCDD